jgi:hypothetical protein
VCGICTPNLLVALRQSKKDERKARPVDGRRDACDEWSGKGTAGRGGGGERPAGSEWGRHSRTGLWRPSRVAAGVSVTMVNVGWNGRIRRRWDTCFVDRPLQFSGLGLGQALGLGKLKFVD